MFCMHGLVFIASIHLHMFISQCLEFFFLLIALKHTNFLYDCFKLHISAAEGCTVSKNDLILFIPAKFLNENEQL